MADRPHPGEVVLRQGPMTLGVLPQRGACWSRLQVHTPDGTAVALLRPLPPGSEDLFASSAYVLVPYSNRLFGQRLLAGGGEALSIALNRPGIADPVHGVGWMKAWTVTGRRADTLALRYRHAADAHWPFDHACTQQLTLLPDRVELQLTVRNGDQRPMPLGIGFHPFLAIDDNSMLRFDAGTRWEQSEDGRPVAQTAAQAPPVEGLRAADLVLNHCFGGWEGPVRLTRPRHGLALTLSASPALGHLQVYRPPAVPWLCAEPVSHATGAWSLPSLHHADAGVRWLAPGAACSVGVRLAVLRG